MFLAFHLSFILISNLKDPNRLTFEINIHTLVSQLSHQRPQNFIAGPNGAGKTTFANEFLPVEAECLNFINADLIAQGLSPFRPSKVAIEAGRLMIQHIDDCVKRNESL